MSTATASKSYPQRGKKPNPCTKGAPNRKIKAKLDARIRGYFATLEAPENRTKNMTGYHKPGSMQR